MSEIVMSENVLTSAEIKRRGLAVIEERLALGPVHLIKRNRRTAVVLSEAQYLRLMASQPSASRGPAALQWLLSYQPQGDRRREDIDAELQEARDW